MSRIPANGERVLLVAPREGKTFSAIVTGRWGPGDGTHPAPRALSLEVEVPGSPSVPVTIVTHRDHRPFPDNVYWIWPEEAP